MKLKLTKVAGQDVTLYSLDGSTWFMKEEEVWSHIGRSVVPSYLALGSWQRERLSSAFEGWDIWGDPIEDYKLHYLNRFVDRYE